MNPEGASFYRSLDSKFQVICFASLANLLTQKIEACNIAASLYPNWKREFLALLRCPADRKVSFSDAAYPITCLFPTKKIKRREVHDIENNMQLLEELNVEPAYPNLSSLFPAVKKKKISLHPTASMTTKYYPVDFWVELIDALTGINHEIHLFYRQEAAEKRFVEQIFGLLKKPDSLFRHEEMPLPEIAAHLSESSFFIGLDSALMHLAALLDVFTIGLWSFADYRRIHPYGNQCHVYIPEEVLKLKRFLTPRKTFPFTARANAKDILHILDSSRKQSFLLHPRYVKEIKFYVY